jgi:hypothetical protein
MIEMTTYAITQEQAYKYANTLECVNKNYAFELRNLTPNSWEAFAYVTKQGILLPPYEPVADDVPLFTAPSTKPADHKLREAVYALLSNEEHAVSGGMRSYAVGSQTWEIWEAVRVAAAPQGETK